MYNVLISGFYGFDNAGDEAILQSIVSQMHKFCKDIDIVVLSARPDKTARDFNIKAVNRFNLLRVYSAIKKCDILISGGGSLFQDVTSISSFWYYSGILLMAFLLKKPVFAFAHGIGPVRNDINKRLLKFVINRVAKVSVRDKRSRNELRNLGIKKKITCTVDPAFLIQAITLEQSCELLKKEMGKDIKHRKKIGFSLRQWKDANHLNLTDVFSEVADRLSRELDVDIILIPLHNREDVSIAEEIAAKMKENAVIINGNYSPSQLIGIYGLLDLSVCIRFHGLVFSVMNNTPVAAISYDPKIDSLMDSLGLDNIIRYGQINACSLYENIIEKWNNRHNICNVITQKNTEFKALAKKGIDEVTEYMKSIWGIK